MKGGCCAANQPKAKRFELGENSGGAYVKIYHSKNLAYTLGGENVMGGQKYVVAADEQWMLDKDYAILVNFESTAAKA